MHFYAWQKGLKTGMYYLRSKAAVDPIKFTLGDKHQQKFVDKASKAEPVEAEMEEGQACTMEEGCLMCGS